MVAGPRLPLERAQRDIAETFRPEEALKEAQGSVTDPEAAEEPETEEAEEAAAEPVAAS